MWGLVWLYFEKFLVRVLTREVWRGPKRLVFSWNRFDLNVLMGEVSSEGLLLTFFAALSENIFSNLLRLLFWLQVFQITRHYSAHHSQKIEMTLEKLQLIATAAVEPEYKVRWLKWWNSGRFNREAIRFPKSPASEDTLKPWLNKAVFWAGVRLYSLSILTFQLFLLCQFLSWPWIYPQLEDAAVKELPDILNALGGLDGDVEVDSLPDYLEKWRICLWDKAFIGHFSGSDIYGKGTWWKDVKGADNIVKRLICRYVSWKILCSPHLFQTICFLSC